MMVVSVIGEDGTWMLDPWLALVELRLGSQSYQQLQPLSGNKSKSYAVRPELVSSDVGVYETIHYCYMNVLPCNWEFRVHYNYSRMKLSKPQVEKIFTQTIPEILTVML